MSSGVEIGPTPEPPKILETAEPRRCPACDVTGICDISVHETFTLDVNHLRCRSCHSTWMTTDSIDSRPVAPPKFKVESADRVVFNPKFFPKEAAGMASTDDDLNQWVYKLRPTGTEKGVMLSGGPFNGMKLTVAPDQGSAEFASGTYRASWRWAVDACELWMFEPTAAKPVSMGDAVVMHMQHLEKAKPPLPLICVFAGSPSPPMVAIRNIDGTPSVLDGVVRYGGRISLNKEVVFGVEPRWADSAKAIMSIPMSDQLIRRLTIGTVYHLELWAEGADGARTFLLIGGLERRPDRKAEAVSLAPDPFAKDWAAPVARETSEPGVYVTEYSAEQMGKACGVPIGYDIEAEESPQPAAEPPRPIKFREFL